jgi:hypothetical protein
MTYRDYISDPQARALIEAAARRSRAEQLRTLWTKLVELWRQREQRPSRWLAVRGR